LQFLGKICFGFRFSGGLGLSRYPRRWFVCTVDSASEMKSQCAMSGSCFEDLQSILILCCARCGDVKVEEGDYKVGILGIDLLDAISYANSKS
jgi:hypothetical protein